LAQAARLELGSELLPLELLRRFCLAGILSHLPNLGGIGQWEKPEVDELLWSAAPGPVVQLMTQLLA
jgi:hypothetical protein